MATRETHRETAGRTPPLQSVVRAFGLIRVLGRSTSGKALSELSSALRLHKSTTFRLLRTLEAEGLVHQDENTGRYAQDPAFWMGVAPFLAPAFSLTSDVRALLGRLAEATNLSASLTLVNALERGIVVPMEADPSTPVHAHSGGTGSWPFHATAAGKCCLAALPEDKLSDYLKGGLEPLTDTTITSPGRLRRELATVRKQGYAFSRGEAAAGAYRLAVPLRGAGSSVVGAVALTPGTTSPPREKLSLYVALLRDTSQAISDLFEDGAWSARVLKARDANSLSPVRPDETDPGFGDDPVPLVRTVARAVRLFAALVRSPNGKLLTEVVRERGLRTTSAFRLLQSLIAVGFVRHSAATGRYGVVPLLWLRLSPVLRSAEMLTSWTHRILGGLADLTGATACLVFSDREGRNAIMHDRALPARPICWHPENLPAPPLHATAAGKCILAGLPKRALKGYMAEGLVPVTENTTASPEKLLRELAVVRDRGYALAKEEVYPGAGAVAVPLTDQHDSVVASVVVVPMVSEFTRANVKQWLPALRVAASKLSLMFVADWRERLRGLEQSQAAASAVSTPVSRLSA